MWPRISVVTAVFNGEIHLEETIRSVLYQEYPNLEYIIIDDGSTDSTPDIIRKYEQHLAWWTSQPNLGMYASLNTGFAKSSGEILGWLNDSDKLHSGALSVVGSAFRDLPQVEWITGRPTGFNEEGMTTLVLDLPHWSRSRFLAGANRYIQQESTFWRRSLWDRAGGHLDASGRCGHVADFELWVRFFRHAQLYPIDTLIGGFRADSKSRTLKDLETYHRLQAEIIAADLAATPGLHSVKLFRRLNQFAQSVPKLRVLWNRTIMHALYRLPGPDWAPVIRFQHDKWKIWR